jgi:hypothetical protein
MIEGASLSWGWRYMSLLVLVKRSEGDSPGHIPLATYRLQDKGKKIINQCAESFGRTLLRNAI